MRTTATRVLVSQLFKYVLFFNISNSSSIVKLVRIIDPVKSIAILPLDLKLNHIHTQSFKDFI